MPHSCRNLAVMQAGYTADLATNHSQISFHTNNTPTEHDLRHCQSFGVTPRSKQQLAHLKKASFFIMAHGTTKVC
jgi:hypothetical protein